MATIPPNLARVPNLLTSQLSLSGLGKTSVALIRAQEQLSTGKRINRISDDAVRAAIVLALDQRERESAQKLRNVQHGSSLLNTLDQALNDASEVVREAAGIASSQVGIGSDATTRANQAVVISSLVQSLVQIGNRDLAGIHVFGGAVIDRPPFEAFLGGYRYVGRGDGFRNDLGSGVDTPITVGADAAFGALSARVRGDVDLNPTLTRNTNLTDVDGARLRGVTLGPVNVTVDDGVTPVTVQVDLTPAKSAGDVLDLLESAIRTADAAALTGAYPSASTTGERLSFAVAAGYTVSFADPGSGTTAADLGIGSFNYVNGTTTNPAGDLGPRLTDQTLLGDLNPATALTYGTIHFRNGTVQGDVTTNAGMSIAEFKQRVAALNLGIRADISADGRSIDVVNEVSGLRMSVEENGGTAATTLGIRSFKASTALSVFNDGRGVEIAHGNLDPISGLPDPARNTDFRITLTDGTSFTVDLLPADVQDVGTLITAINNAAGALFPGTFSAGLSTGGNGLVFTDNAGGAGQTSVTTLNGHAAEDLGLLEGTFTPGSPATFAGSDRATVRVDSALSSLVELRAALQGNDQRGITIAAEALDVDGDRFVQSRALVGARSQRLEDTRKREEDVSLLNQSIRGDLEGVDYTEAATRFSLLQLAQQAGLSSTARLTSLTLLDFLS